MKKEQWEDEMLNILNDKAQNIVLDLRLKDFIKSLLEQKDEEMLDMLDSFKYLKARGINPVGGISNIEYVNKKDIDNKIKELKKRLKDK